MTRTVDLRQLRTQAKELRRALARRDPEALARLAARQPAPADPPTLRDAQLVIAREQGHASWHDLVHAVGTRVVAERDLHRWFAVELNNETWDDLERLDGDPPPAAEGEHLLYGAYAAAYHWLEAGPVIHHARAERCSPGSRWRWAGPSSRWRTPGAARSCSRRRGRRRPTPTRRSPPRPWPGRSPRPALRRRGRRSTRPGGGPRRWPTRRTGRSWRASSQEGRGSGLTGR